MDCRLSGISGNPGTSHGNAVRGVGIWDIMIDEFIPDPALEAEFWQSPVATASEATLEGPDSESEDEFVSDDGEGSEQDSNVDTDEQAVEESDNEYQEPPTPIFNSLNRTIPVMKMKQ